MPQAAPEQAKKKRFGLMKVRVESSHVLTIPDAGGVKRKQQVLARDRSRFPDAKTDVICVHCRDHGADPWKWKDVKSLLAAHPTRSVMQKNEEAHVYFWWSDDPEPSKLAELESERDAKVEALEKGKLAKEEHARQLGVIQEDHKRQLGKLPRIGMLTEDEDDGAS